MKNDHPYKNQKFENEIYDLDDYIIKNEYNNDIYFNNGGNNEDNQIDINSNIKINDNKNENKTNS